MYWNNEIAVFDVRDGEFGEGSPALHNNLEEIEPDVKELTLSQVIEKLGYPVKITKG